MCQGHSERTSTVLPLPGLVELYVLVMIGQAHFKRTLIAVFILPGTATPKQHVDRDLSGLLQTRLGRSYMVSASRHTC